jgi:hypothetical protein
MCIDINAFKAENKQASVSEVLPWMLKHFSISWEKGNIFDCSTEHEKFFLDTSSLMNKCFPYDVEWLKHHKFTFPTVSW